MEGILDRRKRHPFTGRRGERSRRLLHPKDPHAHPKGRGRTSRKRMHARRRVRPREKRESRQGCQRFDRIGHRGKTTPTPVIEVGDGLATGCSTKWKHRVPCDPPKRSRRRETPGSPVMLRGDLRLRGASPRRKMGERAGNARGAGAVSRSGGRRRLDASRVLHIGRSRGLSVGTRRTLAGRKLGSSSDEGHGRVEGETVRGHGFPKSSRGRLADSPFARLLNTTEGALGPRVVRPLRARRYRVL
jgi:hypothetical protein